MDYTAIQQIQNTAISATEVDDTKRLIALPNNIDLHDLEKYQPQRYRFRATFMTDYIADFVRYSEQYTDFPTFIDAHNMDAVSVFNAGDEDDPGHGDNRAFLTLTRTAAYLNVINTTTHDYHDGGGELKQKQFGEWLEDWREHITLFDANADALELAPTINAVRTVKIDQQQQQQHVEQHFISKKTALEEIEASADNPLPALVGFDCIPYHGLSPYRFMIRVSVKIEKNEVIFRLREINPQATTEKLAEEFQSILRLELNAIHTNPQIYLGVFNIK